MADEQSPEEPKMLSMLELVAKMQDDIMKVVASYLEQVPKAYRGQLAMFVASRLFANVVFMNSALAPRNAGTRDGIVALCNELERWLRAQMDEVDAPKILAALRMLKEKGQPAIAETEALRFPGWAAAAITTVWRMGFEELESRIHVPGGGGIVGG